MKTAKLIFEINIEGFCKRENISKEEVEKALWYPSHDVQSLINSILWIRDNYSKGKYNLESLQNFWDHFSKKLIEMISDENLESFPDVYELIPWGYLRGEFLTKWCGIIDKRNKEAKTNPSLKIDKALETYNSAPINTDEKKKSLEILREVSKKEVNKCNGIMELRSLKEIVPRNTPEWILLIQNLLLFPVSSK